MRWLPDNMYRSQWLVNEKINEILNDIDNGEPISETFKFLLYGSLFKKRTYDVPAFLLNDDKKRQKIIKLITDKLENSQIDHTWMDWQNKHYPITWAYPHYHGKVGKAHAFWIGESKSVCGKYDYAFDKEAFSIDQSDPIKGDCKLCNRILKKYGFGYQYLILGSEILN